MRGHDQHLAQPRGVARGDGPHDGGLALHDEGDVLVVGHHLVHHALHRVEADDVLHEAFARAVGLGPVAGQELQHGGVGHQRENQDEEQQHEGHQCGEDACRREVQVPLLAVVGGVEHAEAPLAEEVPPPGTYFFLNVHLLRSDNPDKDTNFTRKPCACGSIRALSSQRPPSPPLPLPRGSVLRRPPLPPPSFPQRRAAFREDRMSGATLPFGRAVVPASAAPLPLPLPRGAVFRAVAGQPFDTWRLFDAPMRTGKQRFAYFYYLCGVHRITIQIR